MPQNINTFLAMLAAANAVTVDDGALLTDWEVEELTGNPINPIVCFSWTDGENDFTEVLTEGGISRGVFDSEGKFVVENNEGEKTVIRFFAVHAIRKLPDREKDVGAVSETASITVSVDGGVTFVPASDGVRIIYADMPIPGEDANGELHINATGEGLIMDVWATRDEPLDHNIGTSSDMATDIISRLVKDNA